MNGYACGLYLAADQSIANNNGVAVSWGVGVWNYGSMWSSGSNPTRITFPVTQHFQWGGTIVWNNNSSGTRLVKHVFNGVTEFHMANIQAVANSSKTTVVPFYTQHRPTSGEYMEIQVVQDSGANLDVLSNAGATRLYVNSIGTSGN